MKSGWSKSIVRCTGLLVLLAVPVGLIRAQGLRSALQHERAKINQVTEAMIQDLERRDWDKFAAHWVDPTRFPDFADRKDDLPLRLPNVHNTGLKILPAHIKENVAFTRAYFQSYPVTSQIRQVDPVNQAINIDLEKVNGEWKISRVARANLDLIEDFITLSSEADKRELLSLNRELLTQECVTDALELGNAALREKEYERALKIFQFMKRVAAQQTPASQLRANLSICFALRHLPDYNDATKSCHSALALARRLKNIRGMSEAMLSLGDVYRKKDSTAAASYYRQSLQLGERSQDYYSIAWATRALGDMSSSKNDWTAAVGYYEKSLVAFRIRKNEIDIAKALYDLGCAYIWVKRYGDAIKLFEESAALAEKSNDRVLRSRCLYWTAQAQYRLKKYKEARETYMRSLPLVQALETQQKEPATEPPDVFDTYVGLAQIEEAQQSYKSAIQQHQLAYNHASATHQQVASAQALLAIADLYDRDGEPGSATENYLRAVNILSKTDDKRTLVDALKKLTDQYESDKKHTESAAIVEKSIRLADELNDKDLKARILTDWAGSLFFRGNYQEALKIIDRTDEIYRQINEPAGQVANLALRGAIYITQGNHSTARQYFNNALTLTSRTDDQLRSRIFLAVAGSYEAEANLPQAIENYLRALNGFARAKNIDGVVDAGNRLALVYMLDKQQEKALSVLRQILDVVLKTGDESQQALTRLYVARLLATRGQNREALQSFQASYEMFKNLGSLEHEFQSLLYQAMLLNKMGRNNEALKLTEEAAALSRKVRVAEYSWVTRAVAGSIYDEQGNLPEARKAFAEAIDSIEQLRHQLAGSEQDHITYFAQRIDAYHSIVDILLRQNEPQAAFEYAERSKARELMDIMQAISPTRNGHQPVNRFQAQEASFLLSDDDTAVLEYVVSEDKLYLFSLARTQDGSGVRVNAYVIPVHKKDLETRVKAFRNSIERRSSNFRLLASELYDLLLGKAQSELSGKTRLIIVPDSILWNVPFQALEASTGRYLIEEKSIAYAPSIAALRQTHHRRDKTLTESRANASAQPVLLAIGNPSTTSAKTKSGRSDLCGERDDLSLLPEAEVEVLEILKLYGADRTGSQSYTGVAATPELVKSEAGKYRVLHFATHAIMDDANAIDSYIVLAKKRNNTYTRFSAREIMGLNLRAELVVLSACETAGGQVGEGEGLIGLSWALAVTGVPTIVASQWKVNSCSTTDLMIHFHRLIKDRVLKTEPVRAADALREASLSLLQQEKYRHPFFWAGFIVVGDGY
jgi:CHAT domain-containing protein